MDLIRYIDRRWFEGRHAHIRERRIPVWVIAHTIRDNEGYGIPEIMYSYDLSEAEALAAMLYYNLHRDEIEKLVAEDHAAFEEMYEKQQAEVI